jgi:hypothetical protein
MELNHEGLKMMPKFLPLENMAISPQIFSSTGFSRDKTVLVLQLHVDAGVLCKVPKNLSCSDQKRHTVSMRF